MRIPFFTGLGDVRAESTPAVGDFVDDLHNPSQIRKAGTLIDRVLERAKPIQVSDTVSDSTKSILGNEKRGLVGNDETNNVANFPENGKFIGDDTVLVIPKHLVMQAPFCIIAQGGDTIPLSALQNLGQNQKSMAIRMLSSLDIKIINGDKKSSIKLNERIPVGDNTGSLHQYLSSGHQIGLTELR